MQCNAEEGQSLRHIPLLRRGSANAHRPIAAIHTLHLLKSALLVTLLGEAHEAVAAGLASVGVGHDLGRLAGGEAGLEQGDQDVLGHLGAKVADEDGELGAAVVAVFKAVRLIDNKAKQRQTYRRSTRPPPEAQFSL